MSIRITEDTPEPKEYGWWFVSRDGEVKGMVRHDHDSHLPGRDWMVDGFYQPWELLLELSGYDMETLAAHDARIRREALELSDEEYKVFIGPSIDAGMLPSPEPIREGLKDVAKYRAALSCIGVGHREASDVLPR